MTTLMRIPKRSWRKQWKLCRKWGHCWVRWFYGDSIIHAGGSCVCWTCGKVGP